MTGGSLPAMVWQRLMTYAHRDIDLKPIPGIENPFVDAEVAAKAAAAEKKRLAEAAEEEAERPAVLSAGDRPAAARHVRRVPRRPSSPVAGGPARGAVGAVSFAAPA